MRRLTLTLLVLAAACAGARPTDPVTAVRRAVATTILARTASAHVEVSAGDAHVAADGEVDFARHAERTPTMRRIGDATYVLPSDDPTWLRVDLPPSIGDPLQSAAFDALTRVASVQSLGGGGYRAGDLDVWLDGGGRIRRLVRHQGPAAVSVDYRDFGHTVDISTPTVAEDLRGASPDA